MFAHARGADGRSSYERLAQVGSDAADVLDVACGDGTLLELVRTDAPHSRLYGVDLSPAELDLARVRLPDAGLIRARAQHLPLRDGSVDVVLCHMALMLMDEPDHALFEARRVLRLGGVFRSVTNRPATAHALTSEILRPIKSLWSSVDPSFLPPQLGDARTWDAEALAALAGACFAHVTVECFDVTQHVPRRELWPYLVKLSYGFDSLPADLAESALNEIALPDPVPWTIPMVEITAR